MRSVILGILLSLVGVGSIGVLTAWGDCADERTNLYKDQNCDFGTDVKGWVLETGDSLEHHPTDGFPAHAPPGALQANFSAEFFILNGPCIATIAASTQYTFGAYLKRVGVGSPNCKVLLLQFSDQTCNSFLGQLFASDIMLTSAGWLLSRGRGTTDVTIGSARMSVTCSGSNTAVQASRLGDPLCFQVGLIS
jgi:hypothetical protein